MTENRLVEQTANENLAKPLRCQRGRLRADFTDLLASVLHSLSLEESITAAVCKDWSAAWKLKLTGVLRPIKTVHSYPSDKEAPLVGLGTSLHCPMGVLIPDYENFCVKQLTADGSWFLKEDVEGIIINTRRLALLGDHRRDSSLLAGGSELGDARTVIIEEDPGVLVQIDLHTGARHKEFKKLNDYGVADFTAENMYRPRTSWAMSYSS